MQAACRLSDIDWPVKPIVLPEGALQGFNCGGLNQCL